MATPKKNPALESLAKKRAISAMRKDDKKVQRSIDKSVDKANTLSSRNMSRVPVIDRYDALRVPAGMTRRSPDRLEALNAYGDKAGRMYGDWIEGGGKEPQFRLKPKKK
jgi:hypothetical protein